MGSGRIDAWLPVALVLPALHFAVYLVLQTRPGLLGPVLWYVAPPFISVAAIGLLILALAQAISGGLTWNGWRVAGYASLALAVVMPQAYRTYPSSRDDEPSLVRFRLPLEGPVTVIWGGESPSVNYHVILPDQRWAYDLHVTNHGRSFRSHGARVADYFAYGQPVLAPASGLVRRSFDGDPDMPPGKLGGGTNPCGNHVVLEVARDEFLFICHMQPQSVRVRVGDRVASGEPIGRVGNSGNTSQPHVHLHLQTTPHPAIAEGIPMYFHDYLVNGSLVERGIPTGGSRTQVVEQANQD